MTNEKQEVAVAVHGTITETNGEWIGLGEFWANRADIQAGGDTIDAATVLLYEGTVVFQSVTNDRLVIETDAGNLVNFEPDNDYTITVFKMDRSK